MRPRSYLESLHCAAPYRVVRWAGQEAQVLDHQEYRDERQNTGTLTIYEDAVFADEAYKLRTVVHVDSSYPEQGWGRCEVWDQASLSWHEVASQRPYCDSYLTKREDAYECAATLRCLADEVIGSGRP